MATRRYTLSAKPLVTGLSMVAIMHASLFHLQQLPLPCASLLPWCVLTSAFTKDARPHTKTACAQQAGKGSHLQHGTVLGEAHTLHLARLQREGIHTTHAWGFSKQGELAL